MGGLGGTLNLNGGSGRDVKSKGGGGGKLNLNGGGVGRKVKSKWGTSSVVILTPVSSEL